MRRHPVILGIGLLSLMGFFFFAMMYGLFSFRGNSLWESDDKIGVIPIEGIIVDAEGIINDMQYFMDHSGIRAVVLRIDTPGGSVAPSQEIYQAVLELRKKKKVVASMGSVAASGGYLIAVAADRIVANPGTITGSISAIMHHANAEALLKKIGIRPYVVKSGKFKDIGSPVRDMTVEERSLIQGIVDDIYDQFIQIVSEHRKIPLARMAELADGRIFTGRQAKALGLIDELGGLRDAVMLAGRLSGMKDHPESVYPAKRKPSLLMCFLERVTSVVSDNITKKLTVSGGAQYIFE